MGIFGDGLKSNTCTHTRSAREIAKSLSDETIPTWETAGCPVELLELVLNGAELNPHQRDGIVTLMIIALGIALGQSSLDHKGSASNAS